MSDYKLENGILQTPSGSCTLTSEFILPQLIGEMVDEIAGLQAQLDEANNLRLAILKNAKYKLSADKYYVLFTPEAWEVMVKSTSTNSDTAPQEGEG